VAQVGFGRESSGIDDSKGEGKRPPANPVVVSFMQLDYTGLYPLRKGHIRLTCNEMGLITDALSMNDADELCNSVQLKPASKAPAPAPKGTTPLLVTGQSRGEVILKGLSG
jgi:hypothetical protein